jgi:hypothetical protein
MNVGSDWYSGIVQKVNGLKNSLALQDSGWSRFLSFSSTERLDPFLSAIGRIDQFSPGCTQCQIFRDDISTLMRNAPSIAPNSDKELQRSFLNDVDKIVNKMRGHFQKEHKLVSGGYYKSLFGGLGWVIGMVCDYLFRDYFVWWVFVGIGAGLAIGAVLDAKAKRENRILFKQPPTRLSKTTVILIFVGIVVVTLVLSYIFVFRD